MFPTLDHLLRYCTGWSFGLSIPTFGFFIALSFWVAYRCFLTEMIRLGIPGVPPRSRTPHKLMDQLLIACAISGFIGAIGFSKLEQDYNPAQPLWPQLLRFNGLNYYGSLLFGALTYLFIMARNGIRFPKAADIGSPGMMLAYGVGRIGCHLAGDGDWGLPHNAPAPSWIPAWLWSSHYPHNVLRQGELISPCNDPAGYCMQLPYPVYPTPLYEAILCIGFFLFLWSIRKKIKTPGLLFGIYALLNGGERFFIEFIRVNPRYHFLKWEWSQAQFFAAGWILIGIFSIFYFKNSTFTDDLSDYCHDGSGTRPRN